MNENKKNLLLIKKKLLVEASIEYVVGLQRSAKSFSDFFDNGNKLKDDYGNDRISTKWTNLIQSEMIPSNQTVENVLTIVTPLRPFYEHLMWDAITPEELSKFQILKQLCKLPFRIRRLLGRISYKEIRKKTFKFSYPSSRALTKIGSMHDLESFSAMILLMRYDKLIFPDSKGSIYYEYEDIAYASSVIIMFYSPMREVRDDIYQYINTHFDFHEATTWVRKNNPWKLKISEVDIMFYTAYKNQGEIINKGSIPVKIIVFLMLYHRVIEQTRHEGLYELTLLPKLQINSQQDKE